MHGMLMVHAVHVLCLAQLTAMGECGAWDEGVGGVCEMYICLARTASVQRWLVERG